MKNLDQPMRQSQTRPWQAILIPLVLLCLLASPFAYFMIGKIASFGIFAPAARNCSQISDCTPESALYVGLNWPAIMSCAALFGALGAMVSLFLRRDANQNMFEPDTITMTLLTYGAVGAMFAILMLALFIGGFVQGNLFPRFGDGRSWVQLMFVVSDWGKTIIWSFIAGFSERLMPNFLDRLVEHFSSVTSKRD